MAEVMSWSLVIGLVVVLVSAAAFWPLLFGDPPEPATIPVRGARSGAQSAQARQPQEDTTHVSLWVRLRGLVGLIGMCAGIGAAIAVVVGGAVFALGLALQS
jgi:hypothetical protein